MEAILLGIFTSLAASMIYDGATSLWKRIKGNTPLEEQLKEAFVKAVKNYFANDELQQEKVIFHDAQEYIDLLKKELRGEPIDVESEKYKKLYAYFIDEVINNPALANYVEIKKLDINQAQLDKNAQEIKDILKNYVERILAQTTIMMENQARMMEMISSRSNSATIRSIIQSYGQDIKELKIDSAYRHLNAIHQSLINESNNDTILLAAVQCSLGICARYIINKSSKSHYDEAYRYIKMQPITDRNLYEQILEGKIYVACKEKNMSDAQVYVDELKQLAPNNFWVYIPNLIEAEDLDSTYHAIPESVHKYEALINAIMIGCKAQEYQLGVDIDTYTYHGLTELTYDNFPIWVFDMSVAATRFVHQFTVRQHAKSLWNKEVEDLYNLTHTYLELLDGTEMDNLLPDTIFMENLTGYIKDQNVQRLKTMEEEKGKGKFKELYYLGYAMMLMDQEKFPEALQLLKEYGDDASSSILNMRLNIGFRTQDKDEIIAVIREVSEKQKDIPDHLLPNYMEAFNLLFEDLEPYAKDIVTRSEQGKLVFEQFMAFKRGDEVNIEKLQEEEPNIEPLQYSFVAMIYKEKLGIDKAIEVLRECADPKVLDMRTYQLLEYYSQDNRYAVEHYRLLKSLRKSGESNVMLLQSELIMAETVMDYEAVCEITGLLREAYPNDMQVMCHHVKALRILGKIDDVIGLESTIMRLPISKANHVKVIASVYESIHETKFAIDFLHRAILETRDQELKDFFYILSLNPEAGAIIYAEHEVVKLNDVVEVEEEAEGKEIEVSSGSVYADLIGKRVGDVVTVRQSEDVNVTIKKIHNKYFRLSREIHNDIESKKSKTIKVFSFGNIEEMENPIEELKKLIGDPQQAQIAYQENLEKYHKADLQLFTFVRGGSVAGMINLLFDPQFTIYNHPPKLYTIGVQEEPANWKPLVLDMSSLILLSELSRRFGMQWERKFLVPISLKMTLCDTLTNEECGNLAHLHEEAQDNMTITISDESKSILWNVTKSMLDWMDANCEVVIVEEKLCWGPQPDADSFAKTEMDSALLASRQCILVTEDWGLQKDIANVCPSISVANMLALMRNEHAREVFELMLACGNIGGDMTAEFIAEQYSAYREGMKNCYQTCVANITRNAANVHAVVDACERILQNRSDKTRREEVTQILQILLEALSEKSVALLLCQVSLSLYSDDLLRCMDKAYRATKKI